MAETGAVISLLTAAGLWRDATVEENPLCEFVLVILVVRLHLPQLLIIWALLHKHEGCKRLTLAIGCLGGVIGGFSIDGWRSTELWLIWFGITVGSGGMLLLF